MNLEAEILRGVEHLDQQGEDGSAAGERPEEGRAMADDRVGEGDAGQLTGLDDAHAVGMAGDFPGFGPTALGQISPKPQPERAAAPEVVLVNGTEQEGRQRRRHDRGLSDPDGSGCPVR